MSPLYAQAPEPAWVRHSSASVQRGYQAALAFERMLVQQLSQSLTQAGGLSEAAGSGGQAGEEGSPASGSDGPFSPMISQALTESLMSTGGLGMAAQLTSRPARSDR